MEKRFYYSPEIGSLQESEQGENDEEPSKACSFTFEEDED